MNFWNYLIKEWGIISQAPVIFLTGLVLFTLIAAGFITWVLEREYRGKLNRRDANIDSLKQDLEATKNDFLRQITKRDEKVLELEQQIQEIEEGKVKTSKANTQQSEYAEYLQQLSDADLIRHAQQATTQIGKLVQRAKDSVRPGMPFISSDQGITLYNTWLSERVNMRVMKYEILKRLPSSEESRFNLLLDSCYEQIANDLDLIMDIINEINGLASKLRQYS
jgi:hypothetical protein